MSYFPILYPISRENIFPLKSIAILVNSHIINITITIIGGRLLSMSTLDEGCGMDNLRLLSNIYSFLLFDILLSYTACGQIHVQKVGTNIAINQYSKLIITKVRI
jgi:hypothetical protein